MLNKKYYNKKIEKGLALGAIGLGILGFVNVAKPTSANARTLSSSEVNFDYNDAGDVLDESKYVPTSSEMYSIASSADIEAYSNYYNVPRESTHSIWISHPGFRDANVTWSDPFTHRTIREFWYNDGLDSVVDNTPTDVANDTADGIAPYYESYAQSKETAYENSLWGSEDAESATKSKHTESYAPNASSTDNDNSDDLNNENNDMSDNADEDNVLSASSDADNSANTSNNTSDDSYDNIFVENTPQQSYDEVVQSFDKYYKQHHQKSSQLSQQNHSRKYDKRVNHSTHKNKKHIQRHRTYNKKRHNKHSFHRVAKWYKRWYNKHHSRRNHAKAHKHIYRHAHRHFHKLSYWYE